ncbi:TPA: chromosomal replication initiator protein DnaA [Candidatus Gastranaerophilales bacterium HUM_3]|jgi:chromosomal replication initiator protein|nr:chromosomal replication initiator protein DnaA [Acinetobacter sp.]CCZ50357.1 chromosomal replication initiator protein DnaA [Acinetobacter sp. CAG:196]DAA84782.1 MAG TPA: chromosomal replication initiator protein DnaA [Candidatus Gastranaerophilales bacterium HUM_3]DAA85795.1 MAG TPA: chromosomal replication initiator protein DnaA [Candidatus Gastranaerophilales bacterium HUM_4]DAA91431.1 MAG TPA: chromosomal replication initiator protein DnaA [Candidatus Gastranaerophilales bacterium HUM_5]
MENIELKRFWEQVKEELLGVLPENAHPWLYPLEVSGYDKGVLTVVTGQMMGRDLLRKNHYNQMVEALKRVSGDENSRLVIIYDETAAKTLKRETEKLQKKASEVSIKEQAMENLANMQSAANLNLKYKFENFVQGENSKFAYKAAMAVAQNPAGKYNPLFIYGNSGLGKTHLMQAIGHYIIFNNPKLKVKYTKTEDYINDYISNSRKTNNTIENMSKFNRKYTNIDIILIDDIQFIESKIKTMENLQYTFDSLYNKGKQIVITSDRLPKEIPTLTAALCSRFEMGLMIELTPPDLETRFEIIKKLATDNDLIHEDEALRYIARNFSNNVRELEGAFTKVCAYAEITEQELTLKLAKEVLKCEESDEGISFDQIARVTSSYFETDIKDIKGTARGQKVSMARHLSIYLCREITNQSFVNIAKYYNKKHTTIMFAYEKIKKEKDTNREISTALREIRQALKVL